MARSNATQDMRRPYTKSGWPPRVSQMPSSGRSQLSHSQSRMLELASSRRDRPEAVGVGEVDRVHGFAVDVELQLVGGAVADAHRARAAVALEVVEHLLVEV